MLLRLICVHFLIIPIMSSTFFIMNLLQILKFLNFIHLIFELFIVKVHFIKTEIIYLVHYNFFNFTFVI
jgi:hypothetical protein